MKSYLKLIAALGVACLMSVTALAADAGPSGTWKWTQPGRNGGPGFEVTLKLELKDGALSGTILGMQGPQGQIPDVAIGDASFKDGAVAFSVTREFNGNKRTSKYEGKIEGDTIKGSVERQNRDGALQKSEWTATRAP
jgi:hypothetical protein